MKKNLLIALFIVGCGTEPEGATEEIAWIYYGIQGQPQMIGCFWIEESFPNLIMSLEGMFQFKDSNENIHSINCENYGWKEYIRYNIDFNYFSIDLVSPIYPQYYDTIMFEYVLPNFP